MSKKLKINEIFYSVQGEGGNKGLPCVFVRLSGCNLNCDFCDTEYQSFIEMTLEEIYSEITKYNCKNIIWTGGEPLLQIGNDAEILCCFHDNLKDFYHILETNGLNLECKLVLDCIDYVTVSPKKIGDLANIFKGKAKNKIKEIRIAFDNGEECKKMLDGAISFNKNNSNKYKIYISPIFIGDKSPYIDLAIECVKSHNADNVCLSVQEHKLLNIR